MYIKKDSVDVLSAESFFMLFLIQGGEEEKGGGFFHF